MGFITNIKDKSKLKNFGKESLVPLAILGVYFIFFYFQKFIPLPNQQDFITYLIHFFNSQGLVFIFLIALVEGTLISGQYAPGGIVLFFSIISAEGDVVRIVLITLVMSIAFAIAYTLDYFLGYYGFNKLFEKLGFGGFIKSSEKLISKNLFRSIFFTYFDTNLASITALSAGFLKVPFRKFFLYSSISLILWNIFWVILLVLFGWAVINFFGSKYLLLIILGWVLFAFYKNFLTK